MQSLCCRMANKVVWKCKPMVTGETVFFVIIAYFVDMWCCHHVFVHQLLDNYHDLITTRVVTGLYRCHELEVYAVAERSQLIHMLVSVCIHRNHRVYILCFYSWCWRGACWCQQNHFVLYSFLILVSYWNHVVYIFQGSMLLSTNCFLEVFVFMSLCCL